MNVPEPRLILPGTDLGDGLQGLFSIEALNAAEPPLKFSALGAIGHRPRNPFARLEAFVSQTTPREVFPPPILPPM